MFRQAKLFKTLRGMVESATVPKGKFKLALISTKGSPILKGIVDRHFDKYFDYDVIESLEQIQSMKSPTQYSACFLYNFGTSVPFTALAPMLNALIPRSPDLRWVHAMSAGVEYLNDAGLKQHAAKVTFTNSKGAYNQSMAEHVLLGILFFTKNIPLQMGYKREHRFMKLPVQTALGATVGIIGYGSIGKSTARILKDSIGARVYAVAQHKRDKDAYTEFIGDSNDLTTVLAKCQYIVNVLPSTSQTAGLFNSKIFATMRPDGVFINIGRGNTVIENDLVDALKRKVIAGAVLDVFEKEPLDAKSELYDMDNVLFTPHTSGYSTDGYDRCLDCFEKELMNFVAGKPLENVVDFSLGY